MSFSVTPHTQPPTFISVRPAAIPLHGTRARAAHPAPAPAAYLGSTSDTCKAIANLRRRLLCIHVHTAVFLSTSSPHPLRPAMPHTRLASDVSQKQSHLVTAGASRQCHVSLSPHQPCPELDHIKTLTSPSSLLRNKVRTSNHSTRSF